jgi:integrase
VPAGGQVPDLEAQAERIAAFLAVREVRVVRDPASARHARVVVLRRDPLADPAPTAWPLVKANRLSLWQPIPVGEDEDGSPVTVTLPERNLLLDGEPGAGKSNVLQLLVAVGALDPSVRLTLFDPKLVELAVWRIEVVDVRYDAGRFGSGYKDRPKSDASIRAVPMAEPVAAAIARRLDGCGRDELVFCGPGGSNGVPRGVRSRLSVGNYRRVYRLAVARAEVPELDPHGPHDLRYTFATWLEDGAVPARVIDELMGHQAGRRGEREGSMIGTRYRHMTEAMQARVVAVIAERLAVALAVMPQVCP